MWPGQHVGRHLLLAQALQRQAVSRGEVDRVAGKLRLALAVHRDLFVLVRPHDVDLQLLLDELLQPRQAERRPDAHELGQVRVAVERLVEAQRPLHLLHQVGEHRPHRLEDLLGVLARRGLTLELLGLVEADLELLDQRLGEVVPADGQRPQPDAPVLDDDHVRRHRADVHVHHPLLAHALLGLVVAEGVVHRQGRKRQRVDIEVHRPEVAEELRHPLLGDREDADLHVGRVGLLEHLVVPLDLLDGEGDLLLGLELDDVGDLLRLDRGQLREPREGHIPRDGGDHRALLDLVLLDQRVELDLDHLIHVQVRHRQDLLERQDVEVRDPHAPTGADQLHRLDRVRPDVDAPGFILGHDSNS